jgi:hypothetical protein
VVFEPYAWRYESVSHASEKVNMAELNVSSGYLCLMQIAQKAQPPGENY